MDKPAPKNHVGAVDRPPEDEYVVVVNAKLPEAAPRVVAEEKKKKKVDDEDAITESFHVLAWILAGIAVATAVVMVVLVARATHDLAKFSWQSCIFVIAGGAFGSAIAALFSSLDRLAHGWELASGEKKPVDEDNKSKDMAVERMVPLFAVRPLLGAMVAWMTYAGIHAGALPGSADTAEKLVFISLLSGFFAKTVLEVLKGVAKGLVGRS